MDAKRLVAGTIVGGMVLFVLGYLIFDLLFASFYVANAGTATGVMRETPLVWAVALGSLAYAALITHVLASRSPLTVETGAVDGALVAFLAWFAVDFTLYGISNVSNLTRTMVDPVLEAVRGGAAGAAIAVVLSMVAVPVK